MVILLTVVTNSFFDWRTGNQRYGPVDFSGTIFVNTDEGLNYVGFVFGYQSNRKFYAVMWRHKNLNIDDNSYNAGIKGLQLKVRLGNVIDIM
jgi:syndecan 4